MTSSRRVLLFFGAVIGLLAVVALVLVLITSNQPVRLLPENTPEGVVQRYILALDQGDYAVAWSFLAPQRFEKPMTFEDWRRSMNLPGERPAYKATLGQINITGDFATVEVVIDTFRNYGGLFDNPVNTNRVLFSLQRTGPTWKITDPFYVWWIY
jgi:hypothetical protein